MNTHQQKIHNLQQGINNFLKQKKIDQTINPLSLHYQKGSSNTTRSKSYKNNSPKIDLTSFDQILHLDIEKQVIKVEPRVTMDQLVKYTLPFGLIPAIVPECKGITVGGAIMGCAAESGSHRWGCFNDLCLNYDILWGDGTIHTVSHEKEAEIFYGIAGSYGSLGTLLSAEIKLIPAKPFVRLKYHFFQNLEKGLYELKKKIHSSTPPDFLDGMIFSPSSLVIVEGNFADYESSGLLYSTTPFSKWFYQHVHELALNAQTESYEESMPIYDYLFRYDQGGFWMGAYLFNLSFFNKFAKEFFFKIPNSQTNFSEKNRNKILPLAFPPAIPRVLFSPWLHSQKLWKLLHKNEKWIQNHLVIQDFCIPENNAESFLKKIQEQSDIYPIWLCPIKTTTTPQIFAPHQIGNSSFMSPCHVINFGVYGVPNHFHSPPQVTKNLEKKASVLGGKKALYSHSYYSESEFWDIYPQDSYLSLRKKTHADGIWRSITEKVLSV